MFASRAAKIFGKGIAEMGEWDVARVEDCRREAEWIRRCAGVRIRRFGHAKVNVCACGDEWMGGFMLINLVTCTQFFYCVLSEGAAQVYV